MSHFARSLYVGLRPHKTFFLYTALAFFAFLVSLGPVIKTHEQNYLMANPLGIFLYFTFPGLSAVRAVSRIGGLISLGIGVSAAVSFMLIRDKFSSKIHKGVFSGLILIFLLLETFPAKGINHPYQLGNHKIPEEYEWLRNTPDEGAVFEWPIASFGNDVHYMKWSTYHMKPLVNGWASFQWDGHEKLTQMKDLSAPESLRFLYAFGPRYLFVHKQDLTFPAWAQEHLGEFRLIKKFDNALVYENEEAHPEFLPDDYWKNFSVSSQLTGEKYWNLMLTFSSPDKNYVSKKKRVLPIELQWKDGARQHIELVFYPTLWRDGDTYNRVIKQASEGTLNVSVGPPPISGH
jgi:hypothetical protein